MQRKGHIADSAQAKMEGRDMAFTKYMGTESRLCRMLIAGKVDRKGSKD